MLIAKSLLTHVIVLWREHCDVKCDWISICHFSQWIKASTDMENLEIFWCFNFASHGKFYCEDNFS